MEALGECGAGGTEPVGETPEGLRPGDQDVLDRRAGHLRPRHPGRERRATEAGHEPPRGRDDRGHDGQSGALGLDESAPPGPRRRDR